MQRIRQPGLLCSVAAVVCFAAGAQQLVVRPAGDEIHVSAPQLHFLSGKPLDRLHDGNAIPFDFQLSVLADDKGNVLRRTFDRFVFSYDLWEEKYSVTRMRTTRAQASHLSAQAAEAWCVEKMEIPTLGLPKDQPLWLRLEIRVPDPRERAANPEEGMSLKALIEVFSRAGKARQPQYWRAEAGPLRLADLRRPTALRGAD